MQKGFTVKSDGDVSREIPDAVIYLPQNRNIIIDSKFSFTVYNQYCNTDSDEEKQKLGKLLTKNIRDRINDLSNTKYHQIEELNTPDLIFMFLGIDDSLSVALKFDPDLVAYADKKRIALISPSILHISIKMVENLWRLDGQRESVIKVYDEAQKLVDKQWFTPKRSPVRATALSAMRQASVASQVWAGSKQPSQLPHGSG